MRVALDLEARSAQKPVEVAGAEGLEICSGSCLLVADDPADYRKNLLLLAKKSARLAMHENAVRFVKEKLSHQACFGKLLGIIQEQGQ